MANEEKIRKWNNQCPECNSKKVHEDAVDVYYSTNPSRYYCDDCGAEIVVEAVPFIKKIIKKTVEE